MSDRDDGVHQLISKRVVFITAPFQQHFPYHDLKRA
jgi:hypothetical protein